MIARARLAVEASLVLLLLADGTAQHFAAIAIPGSLLALWAILDAARAQREIDRKAAER